MTWLQMNVFAFWLDPPRAHASRSAKREPQETALSAEEANALRAGLEHLERLHTPHPLSGPGARLFQHLV